MGVIGHLCEEEEEYHNKSPREEVIEAWYMDDSDNNQRLPHHRKPKKFVSLDKLTGKYTYIIPSVSIYMIILFFKVYFSFLKFTTYMIFQSSECLAGDLMLLNMRLMRSWIKFENHVVIFTWYICIYIYRIFTYNSFIWIKLSTQIFFKYTYVIFFRTLLRLAPKNYRITRIW